MTLRAMLLPLACFLLAAAVGVGAILDHHAKETRINRAEAGEWYCTHLGTHCGGPSSTSIERRWNEREVVYEIAVVALSAVGAAVAARRVMAS